MQDRAGLRKMRQRATFVPVQEEPSMGAVIRTEGLAKRFGTAEALEPLDPEVEAGEVIGYLRPNGAGTTTSFRLLLGLNIGLTARLMSWADVLLRDEPTNADVEFVRSSEDPEPLRGIGV